MLALPLTGWAIASTSDITGPTILYGVVHWPNIPIIGTVPFEWRLRTYGASVGAHHLLARITYALVGLHVLAALRHQFIKRDYILARMIPSLAPRPADLRNKSAG
jgi:cytochrome b561